MYKKLIITAVLCLGAFMPLTYNIANAQSLLKDHNRESLKKVHEYIAEGGLRNFQILSDNIDNDIGDVVEELYKKQGEFVKPVFTFYTDNYSFEGALLEETDHFYTVVEQTRVNPQTVHVKKIHYIKKSDVIGLTAEFF